MGQPRGSVLATACESLDGRVGAADSFHGRVVVRLCHTDEQAVDDHELRDSAA